MFILILISGTASLCRARFRSMSLAVFTACFLMGNLSAAAQIEVPLTANHWRSAQDANSSTKTDVSYISHEGFPQGMMVLKSGSVVLDGFTFRDGTIEFDMKATEQDIPGIQFRRRGEDGHQDAEEFYLRSLPDCRASNDCIQYSPVIHGFMLWNAYPQYQTQAPILEGWNHFKLVVNGRRLNVYINHSPQPILSVGSLESGSGEGAIQLRGPAVFANLSVRPGAVQGLSPQPTPDPTASDPGIVRQWLLGPLTPAVLGKTPTFSEAPADSTWRSITAGRFGLVNLNREFQLVRQPPSLTWLRTTIKSDKPQEKLVQLGWLGHVWVFVNGNLITEGKNFYEPDSNRREPDGRLSVQNGSFRIPLQKGANQITLVFKTAIRDDATTINFYGWGTILRFTDATGLHLGR